MVDQATVEELTQFRRELHAHPEVSGSESETEKRVLKGLDSCDADQVIQIGKHGIVAVYEGKEPGETTLLRGDMDALPIQEINTFDYHSKNDGVAHLCGHDGHTACLLGVAKVLKNNPPVRGRVVLLFQPAEEDGRGAVGVYNDPLFKSVEPNRVFAWHNIPGEALHQVIVKPGVFTAAAKSIIIKLYGKTAHAAEPEKGYNPALAMAQITQEALKLTVPKPSDPAFRLVTPVFSHMGEKAYGVSAGFGELHFTLRTFDNTIMKELDEQICLLSERTAKENNLKAEISYTESFDANENELSCTERVKQVALKSGFNVTDKKEPFKWGEDFGVFSSRYPGCMFGIGAGEELPALHNPDYDFPDALLPTGIALFNEIITAYHR